MGNFNGEPIIKLEGLGLLDMVTDLVEDLRVRKPDHHLVVFLDHAIESLTGWVPGNWYAINGSSEPFMITGIHIDLYRQRWWFTYSNYTELLNPNRVDWEGEFPYSGERVDIQPVSLEKFYDADDMCVTCNVVHLVMQNAGDDYVCYSKRQADIAERELLAFEASMC